MNNGLLCRTYSGCGPGLARPLPYAVPPAGQPFEMLE
jgi:hypothetical protein